jgi:hypothetical protein
MGRFVDRLVNQNDGAMLKILHSTKVPENDKREILQYLGETIEKEYSSVP